MKAQQDKMQDAINTLKSTHVQVRKLVNDALINESDEIKNDVLAELKDLFEGVESFLAYIKKADLTAEFAE
ncbi:MAG: hypothetical protein IKR94_01685 [Bacteroidales bacterium]|nr:hypothetical protein [Salinivirgaceae bacterium]MBR4214014.1 hypothetical protein [Bacteroidales bacterium]